MKAADIFFALLLSVFLGGLLPAAAPGQPVLFYSETLNADPGWTAEGDWAFGQPAGQGGCAPHPTPSPGQCIESWGYPDPDSGRSGDNVYGYNLEGDYADGIEGTYYLTSPAIDCSGYRSVTLKFYRWLNVERSNHDLAVIEASSDGGEWINIWTNPGDSGKPVTDYSWESIEYGIGSVADRQAAVRLRWGLGPTDEQYTASGWNIDDIELWGIPPSPSPIPTASPTLTPFGYRTPSPTVTPVPTLSLIHI